MDTVRDLSVGEGILRDTLAWSILVTWHPDLIDTYLPCLSKKVQQQQPASIYPFPSASRASSPNTDTLFCSVLFCSVPFRSVLFPPVLFRPVLFRPVLFRPVLSCPVLSFQNPPLSSISQLHTYSIIHLLYRNNRSTHACMRPTPFPPLPPSLPPFLQTNPNPPFPFFS